MSGNMKFDGGNPSAVNKNPKVIKAAQNEIGKIDVLVCGSCFNVFHFVEEFQLHKLQEDCVANPEFKQPSPSETKPQVWAFLLWKSSILNESKRFGDTEQIDELGSWHLYQNWCKLEDKVRDSWIAAGRAIQGFASIANAKIQEVRNVPEKGRVVATKPEPQDVKDSPRPQPAEKSITQSKVAVKKISPHPSSLDRDSTTAKESSIKKETVFNAKEKNGTSLGRQSRESSQALRSKPSAASSNEDNYDSENNVSPASSGSQGDSVFTVGTRESFMPDIEIKEEQVSEEEDESQKDSGNNLKARAKEPVRNMDMNSNKVVRKSIKDAKMLDGNITVSEEEYVVEKILAKRYNPKKKCFEYLLKWEGYPHEQNTWEPVENMQACENLVEAFERNLAKQKMMQQQPRPAVPAAIQPPQRPTHTQQRPVQQPPPQRPVVLTPRAPGAVGLRPQQAGRPLHQGARMLEPPPLAPIVQRRVGRPPGPRVVPLDTDLDHMEAGPSDVGSDSRPVRSSKKKAMEQVKSWCGSMAKTLDFDGKRKHDDDSDSEIDDPPEKRVKSEPDYDKEWSGGEIDDVNDSNPSDEEVPRKVLRNSEVPHSRLLTVNHTPSAHVEENKVVVKRRPGRPRKEWGVPNGVSFSSANSLKKPVDNKLSIELGLESDSSPERKKVPSKSLTISSSQAPVLVANSKGIITVDPRHVPNLTSGVFIVSKKPSSIVCESQTSDKNNIGDQKSPVVTSKSSSSSGNIIVDIKSTLPQSGIIRKTAVNSRTPVSPIKILPKPSGSEQSSSKPSGSQPESTQSTSSQPKPSLSKLNIPGGNQVKPISSGLVRLPAAVKSPVVAPRTTTSVRPLVAGQRAVGPHSVAMMSARPGMGLGPRPPLSLRPGIRRSPMLGTRPRMPSNVTSLSPGTQVKSGIKPIQAMLGKTVQNYGKLSPLGQQKMAQKQQTETASELRPVDKVTVVPNSVKKDLINVVDVRAPLPKGRPPKIVDDLGLSLNKVRDSKLVDSDSLHMEFQEVHSSSDSDNSSDGGLPELPMGDLPPLEPESPPRPLTLCPETGKILMRAEGEPTPPPSPEPVPEPPKPDPVVDVKPKTETFDSSSAGGSLPILDAEKVEQSDIVQDETPEEILPDRRDDDDEDMMQGLGQQTLLKVEMSPGGTTGTLVRRDSGYIDTVRTEQGLTVTKISSSDTRSSQEVVVTSATSPAKLGGISVPARKLFEPDEGVVSAGAGGVGTELVTITGEDGVVYQIATDAGGEGGAQDGACVYVTADQDGEGTVLTLDTAVAEAVAQLLPDQVVAGGTAGSPQFYMKGTEEDGGQVMITSGLEQGGEETLQAQVVAQVVQEGESASGSGGTRRVVLMLPDGNLMMTEVDEEQFAALDLDK